MILFEVAEGQNILPFYNSFLSTIEDVVDYTRQQLSVSYIFLGPVWNLIPTDNSRGRLVKRSEVASTLVLRDRGEVTCCTCLSSKLVWIQQKGEESNELAFACMDTLRWITSNVSTQSFQNEILQELFHNITTTTAINWANEYSTFSDTVNTRLWAQCDPKVWHGHLWRHPKSSWPHQCY